MSCSNCAWQITYFIMKPAILSPLEPGLTSFRVKTLALSVIHLLNTMAEHLGGGKTHRRVRIAPRMISFELLLNWNDLMPDLAARGSPNRQNMRSVSSLISTWSDVCSRSLNYNGVLSWLTFLRYDHDSHPASRCFPVRPCLHKSTLLPFGQSTRRIVSHGQVYLAHTGYAPRFQLWHGYI